MRVVRTASSVYFKVFRKGMIFPVLYAAPAFVHGDLSVSTFRLRLRLTVRLAVTVSGHVKGMESYL